MAKAKESFEYSINDERIGGVEKGGMRGMEVIGEMILSEVFDESGDAGPGDVIIVERMKGTRSGKMQLACQVVLQVKSVTDFT